MWDMLFDRTPCRRPMPIYPQLCKPACSPCRPPACACRESLYYTPCAAEELNVRVLGVDECGNVILCARRVTPHCR